MKTGTAGVRRYRCELRFRVSRRSRPVWDVQNLSSYPHCVEMAHLLTEKKKHDLVLLAPTKPASMHNLIKGGLFFFLAHFSCHINKDIPHLFDRIFPESLRWLLATQQYSRSKLIMGHIAKKNQANVELDPDNILTGE